MKILMLDLIVTLLLMLHFSVIFLHAPVQNNLNCTPSCRSALLQFADKIGCCYQEVFNNTFYFHQLVLTGIITTSEFTDFTVFNNPFGNLWTVCNVQVPSKCPDQPPPDGS